MFYVLFQRFTCRVDGFVVGRDVPHISAPQHTTQTRIVLSLDPEFIASAITVCKSRRRKLRAFGWKLVVEALEGVRDATKLSRSTLVLIIRKNISQVVLSIMSCRTMTEIF